MKLEASRRLQSTHVLTAGFRLFADWFGKLSPERQQQYIAKHPRSKYARQHQKQKAPEPKVDTKLSDTKSESTPEQRLTPKALEKSAHAAADTPLSSREAEAFTNYTGSMFRSVNTALREGKKIPKEDREDVKVMDKAFAKSRTKAPMTVYRGLSFGALPDLKPGQEFSDAAYTSTSPNKKAADSFSRGEGKTLMEIKVPKGAKAISTESISQFGAGSSKHIKHGESEILLDRNSKYRVVTVKPATRTMPRRVVVELMVD